MTKYRIRERAMTFLVISAMSLVACDRPATSERPDVVLVVVDTLRADHLRAYGFEYDTSPNFDSLASESVLWERAVAASSLTAPSHASMMTSRFVRGHSIGSRNGSSRLVGRDTLATRFRRAGYATAAFVSNYVLGLRIGLDQGFDVYDADLPTAEASRETVFERIAEQTTDAALAWLEEQPDTPYFLWVHYQDPHGPYTPPSPHDVSFPDLAQADGRELRVLRDHSGRGGIPRYQALRGIASLGGYRRAYAGEIEYFDRSLGRLLRAIDRRSRDTIVLLTADHGESMGEGDRYFCHGHATTLDQVHVPLLIRAPGLDPGRRRDVVHHVDILPTLLELAGLEPVEEASGLALGPFARDGRPLPARFLFSDSVRDATVFHGDRIVRIESVADQQAVRSKARKTAYAWTDRDVEHPDDSDRSMERAIRDYLGTREAIEPILGVLDPRARSRLRALGYLAPDVGDRGD